MTGTEHLKDAHRAASRGQLGQAQERKKQLSNIPGFDDPVLIRLTNEDIRIIKAHGCPDEEFMDALAKASQTADGVLLGCRRECLVDVNCVLAAVSEEIEDQTELTALVKTYEKIEVYEFG